MIRIAIMFVLLSTSAFAATKDLSSIPRERISKAITQMLSGNKTKAFAVICDEKTCAVINIAEEK